MTSSRLRCGFATFALAAVVSLLAAGPAQAARWRESDPAPRAVATRSILQEVWSRLTNLWEAASISWDGNG